MTDRELLELAAKASGIDIIRWNEMLSAYETNLGLWNALYNDGDALRLAEKLGLTICMDGIGTVSACDETRKYDVFVTQLIQECGTRIAATRRAIVRAAAEIGRGME